MIKTEKGLLLENLQRKIFISFAMRKRQGKETEGKVMRMDTEAIKKQLLEAVANDEYWDCLCAWMSGRLSRKDFDDAMRRCLVTDKAKYLHNELIRSILYNAHFASLPPASYEKDASL